VLTLLEVLQRTSQFLSDKGVADARLNAELLIGHVMGLRRLELYLQFERPMEERTLAQLRPLVRRRGLREPLQYIISPIPFADCQLKSDARALVPRPETELLFERIITHLGTTQPARILDLGTGTGALALALAKHFANAEVIASDCSEEALTLAAENAALNDLTPRLTLRCGNWWQAVQGEQPFDLIVSNPPYLTTAELQTAEPEVAGHDPRIALVSGDDGLEALHCIIAGAPDFLTNGGLLALETGIEQREPLALAFSGANWGEHWGEDDLSGRQRFYFAKYLKQ
jgi:release factor glutamine methyltransferase